MVEGCEVGGSAMMKASTGFTMRIYIVASTRTIIVDGVEYEIVWSGEEGLIPDRATKPADTWEPPKRMYNKTGKHKGKSAARPRVDKSQKSAEPSPSIEIEPVELDITLWGDEDE